MFGRVSRVVEGAIFAREVVAAIETKRIRPVPYDPLLKVHTVWDLGWNDATAIILCQRAGSEVRVIEYLEGSHKTLAEWAGQLALRPYLWGADYLPHDGRSKNLQTGKSPEELLKAMGRKVQIVPNQDIEQGIGAVRMMFGRVYFDEVRAARLVECLKRYRRRINQQTGQPEGPEHDEYSHGADAFRYLAVVVDKLHNDDDFFGQPFKPDMRGIV
jgi:phage terminase large subunit